MNSSRSLVLQPSQAVIQQSLSHSVCRLGAFTSSPDLLLADFKSRADCLYSLISFPVVINGHKKACSKFSNFWLELTEGFLNIFHS